MKREYDIAEELEENQIYLNMSNSGSKRSYRRGTPKSRYS
jgi:hypothetical protein